MSKAIPRLGGLPSPLPVTPLILYTSIILLGTRYSSYDILSAPN